MSERILACKKTLNRRIRSAATDRVQKRTDRNDLRNGVQLKIQERFAKPSVSDRIAFAEWNR
jgi:hypothetical protein